MRTWLRCSYLQFRLAACPHEQGSALHLPPLHQPAACSPLLRKRMATLRGSCSTNRYCRVPTACPAAALSACRQQNAMANVRRLATKAVHSGERHGRPKVHDTCTTPVSAGAACALTCCIYSPCMPRRHSARGVGPE